MATAQNYRPPDHSRTSSNPMRGVDLPAHPADDNTQDFLSCCVFGAEREWFECFSQRKGSTHPTYFIQHRSIYIYSFIFILIIVFVGIYCRYQISKERERAQVINKTNVFVINLFVGSRDFLLFYYLCHTI